MKRIYSDMRNIRLIIIMLSAIIIADSSSAFSKPSRIVGGIPVTDTSKYPWMTALVYSDTEDIYDGQFCGGTLIAPDWIVTAAHCVCDTPEIVMSAKEINVVLGTVDLQANPDSYERIEVSRIIVDPDYNPYLTDNDAALLKLKTQSSQQPIEFLSTEESDPSLWLTTSDETVMAAVVGWGDTEAQKQRSSYPTQLQEVDLPLVSNEMCGAYFGEGEITDNMLCAGFLEGGKDSCFGDSGGPLVIPYTPGGYNLIGIVSWGYGCAQPDSYGVYTRVSKMRDWIFEQIESADAPIILTDSTPTTVYSGSDIVVYGSKGVNNLTIQSGAHAKLINFPGINIITIQAVSSNFLVSRSGAMVTLKDTDSDTLIIMPATSTTQLIAFENLTTILQIQSDKVMLGNQEITKTESYLDSNKVRIQTGINSAY